jgi:hypothetical protein
MSATLVNSIELLLIGGGLGIGGQLLRAFVGWIKWTGQARVTGKREAFVTSQFFFSTFVGFIAGSAAALLSTNIANPGVPTGAATLCLAAAGYAGTDFVEGIVGRLTASSAAPFMASRGRANLLRD